VGSAKTKIQGRMPYLSHPEKVGLPAIKSKGWVQQTIKIGREYWRQATIL
jgi:hypothetical protein